MIKKIFMKYKEIILYIIFGILTTIVNYIVYFSFTKIFNLHYIASNIISWVLAVAFSYIVNKKFVFQTKNQRFRELYYEITLFVSSRFMSLFVETSIMIIMVDYFYIRDDISKIIVGVIITILNYLFSKIIVFRKKIYRSNSTVTNSKEL